MDYIESTYVLLVDDSEFFLSLAADQLETEHGIETATATDPVEALSILDGQSFDCVVSDYDMPETNGIEFYRQVSARYDDLPFVLLTSRTGRQLVSEAIGAGVDEYLGKDAVSEADGF